MACRNVTSVAALAIATTFSSDISVEGLGGPAPPPAPSSSAALEVCLANKGEQRQAAHSLREPSLGPSQPSMALVTKTWGRDHSVKGGMRRAWPLGRHHGTHLISVCFLVIARSICSLSVSEEASA